MAVFGKIYTFLIRATGLVSKPTRQIQETEEKRSSFQQRQLSLLALSAHDVILFNMAAVAGGTGRVRTDAHDVTHDVTHGGTHIAAHMTSHARTFRCRHIKSHHAVVLINLCIALLVANLVFVTGVDKTDNEVSISVARK